VLVVRRQDGDYVFGGGVLDRWITSKLDLGVRRALPSPRFSNWSWISRTNAGRWSSPLAMVDKMYQRSLSRNASGSFLASW
jgi:hypothetical protein